MALGRICQHSSVSGLPHGGAEVESAQILGQRRQDLYSRPLRRGVALRWGWRGLEPCYRLSSEGSGCRGKAEQRRSGGWLAFLKGILKQGSLSRQGWPREGGAPSSGSGPSFSHRCSFSPPLQRREWPSEGLRWQTEAGAQGPPLALTVPSLILRDIEPSMATLCPAWNLATPGGIESHQNPTLEYQIPEGTGAHTTPTPTSGGGGHYMWLQSRQAPFPTASCSQHEVRKSVSLEYTGQFPIPYPQLLVGHCPACPLS